MKQQNIMAASHNINSALIFSKILDQRNVIMVRTEMYY